MKGKKNKAKDKINKNKSSHKKYSRVKLIMKMGKVLNNTVDYILNMCIYK